MCNRKWIFATVSAMLLVMLLLLASCNGETNAPETDASEQSGSENVTSAPLDGNGSEAESKTEALTENFNIVENGVCNFVLVASENASSAEETAFLMIRNAIADLTGATPEFTNDWIPIGSSHDPDTYEILIGKTNYTESWEILNHTSYGSYRIAVVGNKIVLTSWAETALEVGTEAFIDILELYVQNNNLIIPRASISGTQVVDNSLENIPVVPNLEMDHVYDANGASEAIYEHASIEDYNAYIEKLDRDGYEKYAEHVRGGVSSAIYTYDKKYTYHIFYEGAYKELCVLVEPYNAEKLPPKEADYTKACDTQFAQVGVEYQYTSSVKLNSVQNGMCYVWRLEDGRFIIMDGGFNYKGGATNLLNTLRQMAVNPNKIVIASWIITHFHGDHVGTLVKFVQNYLYDAEIQSLLFNLPTLEQSKLDNMNWSAWNTISNQLGKFNPDLIVYKAHPGQIYHFANAEVEILYTLEMTAPDDLLYYNTCSLITDVRFGDFNMMMLGDCSEVTNKNILANYGEALEAEVVQVAHHGYQGGSNALYRAIDPIYVFWPAGTTWYSTCEANATEDPSADRSGYFFMKNTRVAYIFAAKSAVYVCGVQDNGFSDCKRYANVNALLNEEYQTVQLK